MSQSNLCSFTLEEQGDRRCLRPRFVRRWDEHESTVRSSCSSKLKPCKFGLIRWQMHVTLRWSLRGRLLLTSTRLRDVFSQSITSSIFRGSRRKSNLSINNVDIVWTIQVDPVAALDSKLFNFPVACHTKTLSSTELRFAQLITNVQDQIWIPTLTVRIFTQFLTEKKATRMKTKSRTLAAPTTTYPL